jgi:LuxR family maltose regulon positive regulatory protein
MTLADRAEAAEPLWRQIEQQLGPEAPSPERDEILGHVAAMRAMSAVMRGDVPQAIELAQRADGLLPAGNVIPRNTICYTLASAHYAHGDLPAAEQQLAEVLRLGRAADNVWLVVRALCDLADMKIIRGQLRSAADICRDALRQVEERGELEFGTQGYVLVKLGEVLTARNDLAGARARVAEGVDLMQGWGRSFEMVSGCTTLASILLAQDDVGAARQALQRAEEIAARHPHYAKLNSLVRGCRVGLWLAQAGPEPAAQQALQVRLGEHGAPPIFREREQIVLARVHVAGQSWDPALSLLAPLADAAEAGGRFGRLVEILVLQALAWQGQGQAARAVAALARALAFGGPEGIVRPFVDGGPAMVPLLQQAAARGVTARYVNELLAAFGTGDSMSASPPSSPKTSALVEPLSGRERQVLQLMGEGRSHREIAAALVVTINTVKKHAANIYGKLGVHSRTQAVVRAQELGLL